MKHIIRFGILGLISLVAISCSRKEPQAAASTTPPPRVLVGYQTAWATTGQLMETLVHTNITKLHGSNATFRTFLFGPDQNEAAVSGNIDGTTVGIVPAINLMALRDDWIAVCRLIDFPVSTVSRTGSGITKFTDLRGRKLGVPFGSGAHPYIVQRLRDHNLPIGTGPDSVELINVSPTESATALQQGAVDAIATWEPNTTTVETKGFGKSFDDKRYVGVLVLRKSLVDEHPEEVVALIKSIIEANLYVAQHREQTDAWFAQRSNFNRDLLKKIRAIEPNLKAINISQTSVQITPDDITLCQEVADQMHASGLIKQRIAFAQRIDTRLAARAAELIRNDGSKLNQITIATP